MLKMDIKMNVGCKVKYTLFAFGFYNTYLLTYLLHGAESFLIR